MIYQAADNVKFAVLKEMSLTYKLLSLAWISSRTVIFIDLLEQAHVVDVKTTDELEVVNLANVGLAYSTNLWKSLVSSTELGSALSCSGDRLCYESLASVGGQLIILGMTGIHVFSVRTWLERLNILVCRRQFGDALMLAQSFYNKLASSGTDAASDGRSKRREAVAQRILEMLAKYMDHIDTVSTVRFGDSNTSHLYHVCIACFTQHQLQITAVLFAALTLL